MSNDKEKITRKLRAVMSADVKGYSVLMPYDKVTMEGNSMNLQKRFSILYIFFILSFLIISGCSSSILPINKNEPLPPIVKKHKSITLSGNMPGMQDTGVYLNSGDYYSILATGSIDMGAPKNFEKPEKGHFGHGRLIARIGEDGYFRPLYGRKAVLDLSAYSPGKLYLGIQVGSMSRKGEPNSPEYYDNIKGNFKVDIVVWEREDWVQVANLFDRMKEKDPSNKAIIDANEQANQYKAIVIARTKASEEIENTKKQLQELKVETLQIDQDTKTPVTDPETSNTDTAGQEKIKELETTLAELMKTVAQIDEMKAQLEEERKKTAQLSQELNEMDEREKVLLNRIEDGSKNPPVIVIAVPSDGQKTEGKVIQFSGVVEDDDGLTSMEIIINNKLFNKAANRGIKVVGEKKSPRRIHFNEKIPLENGVNQILIRAVDTEGLSANKSLTVHNVEKQRNIWAAVIGINEYQNTRKLRYAVNDAKEFHKLLIRHNKIPKENVTLLINQEATLANIRSSLGTQLKNKAGKEDMVIIYFAGHGATERDVMSPDGDGLEKYLLPYNADSNDLYSSALPMREISHILHRIRSERIIFIADACYSGAGGGRTVSFFDLRASISDTFLDRIVSGKGTIILTASGANEVSEESEKLGHGVFTYYLLEGLKGKADTDNDNLITVDEVYRYVSEHVPKATAQEQHPVKKGSVEGRLILGIIP